MAVTSFIPEVWNARLLNALRADLVYTNLFNRNYEGEIRQAGDTVHINTITDITIKDYTRNTDIDNPEQLTTTDRSISEVAEEMGILDVNYFAKIFKRTFGMTPTRYRRETRKK